MLQFSCTGDDTHNKKQVVQLIRKGVKPIKKIIAVYGSNCQNGHQTQFGYTYLRRAKGLIKKGRADWLNNNQESICLFNPPMKNLNFVEDDNYMDNININNSDICDTNSASLTSPAPVNILDEMANTSSILQTMMDENKNEKASMCEILKRLDMLLNNTNYMHDAFESINRIGDSVEADVTKIEAVKTIVIARETTNQKILDFLKIIYEGSHSHT